MKQSFDSIKFGKAVKVKRTIDNNLGLREAAKKAKVSPATLSRIENNKISDLKNVLLICSWLKCSITEFIIIK